MCVNSIVRGISQIASQLAPTLLLAFLITSLSAGSGSRPESLQPAPPPSAVTLTVDVTKTAQTWEAWRASGGAIQTTASCGHQPGCSRPIPDAVLNSMLDDFVFDLGFTGLRFGPHRLQQPKSVKHSTPKDLLVTVNGTTFDFTKTWLNPDGVPQDGREQITKFFLPMKQRVESQGHTFSTSVAPDFHYVNLDAAMHTPSGMADFAEAYVTWFHLLAGFYPTYYAMVNEPDGEYSTHNELFPGLVAISARFKARGIPTRIASLEEPIPYFNDVEKAVLNPAIATGIITFHAYDYVGPNPPDFTSRNQVRDLARAHHLRTAMTEICDDGSFHRDFHGTYAQALGWARDIYWNMTEADISVWEPLGVWSVCKHAGCQPGEGGDPFAFDPDLKRYHKLANYYGLRQYSHYIRPGHTRVAVYCSGCTNLSSGQNVKPVVFQSPEGKIVTVVMNDQASGQTIVISGLPAGVYDITGVTPQATTGTTFPTQAITAGQSLTLSFPAQAILTIAQQ